MSDATFTALAAFEQARRSTVLGNLSPPPSLLCALDTMGQMLAQQEVA